MSKAQKTHSADASVAEAIRLMDEHPGLAEALLVQTLKHYPNHKAALEVCGVIQHNVGKNEEASKKFELLTQLDPNYADNWVNLGSAYGGLGFYEKAIEVIEHAIRMDPKQALYRNNLALQYKAVNRHEDAIKQLKTAINLGPSPSLWDNLGGIYTEMEQYEEAIECHKKAIMLNPKFIQAQINLSLAYHFNGDWKNGFKQYEWRFFYYQSLMHYIDVYDISKMWDGKADLSGKRVLVFGEQGYGDIIMFSRFLKGIKDRGAYVMFHIPSEMNSFFSRLEGVDEIVNSNIMFKGSDPLPEYDYQLPLMSAPYLLNIDEIAGKSYINIEKTDRFENVFSEYKDNFKVGIVWSGNSQNPDNKDRSIPVEHFRRLLNIENVKIFSLQTGDEACSVATANGFIDLDCHINNFASTAELINCLDLVICCDTAVAHIAGSIGAPVWDLIRFGPDWRWPKRMEKTCWYDSMVQFHQKERGNWSEVFDRVVERLKKEASQK